MVDSEVGAMKNRKYNDGTWVVPFLNSTGVIRSGLVTHNARGECMLVDGMDSCWDSTLGGTPCNR